MGVAMRLDAGGKARFSDHVEAPDVGRMLRELAIEINDEEELSIQDNSFYSFSMKVVPSGVGQTITLASKFGAPITKKWGRTTTG